MDFSYSPKVQDLQTRVTAFMQEHIFPAEARFEAEMKAFRAGGNAWQPAPVMEELKAKARAAEARSIFAHDRCAFRRSVHVSLGS